LLVPACPQFRHRHAQKHRRGEGKRQKARGSRQQTAEAVSRRNKSGAPGLEG
jgi:hypothetical protein